MARRSKLTPETSQRIVEALGAGNTRRAASEYAGVSESTFYRWMERGERESTGPYRELWEGVKKAEASAEVRNVAIIAKAATTTWQAAAWWLERKRPDDWGRRNPRQEQETNDKLAALIAALGAT